MSGAPATLRFTRDKRGYEHFYLVQPASSRRGKGQPRILYWFRTPPGIRVGRPPFDDEMRRRIEAQNPEVVFDWPRLLATPVPPPSADIERWRERRRIEKAEKAARAARKADLDDDGDRAAEEADAAEASEVGPELEPEDTAEINSVQLGPDTPDEAGASGEPNAAVAGPQPATTAAGGRRRRRRRRRGRHKPGASGATAPPPTETPSTSNE